MIVYFSVLIIAPILLMLGKRKNNGALLGDSRESIYHNYNKLFVYLSYIFILFFAVIRYDVGPDYHSYLSIYESAKNFRLTNLKKYEPGYYFICFVLGKFIENGFWHFGLFSAITYWLIYKWILKNTRMSAFALYLFFAFGYYITAFVLVTQWVAVPILFLSYTELKNKNNKKAFCLALCACLFHYSAVVALPVLLFACNPRRRITHIIFIGLSIFFYLFYDIGIDIIYRLYQMIPWLSGGKYQGYFDKDWIINGNVLANPLFCLITYVFVSIYEKKMKAINKNIYVYVNILVMAFCISIIGQRLFVFNRLQWYFVPIIIILLTNVAETMPSESKNVFIIICLVLGFAFFVYGMLSGAAGGLPYKTIFS